MKWLEDMDDQMERKTLLLLDSCPAHTRIDYRDEENKTPWKYLRIVRLPVNSTSVTQPLDAGVISVFKRAFLEQLSQETSFIRTDDNKKKNISNGEAWTLIPSAWGHLKPRTLRSCFAKTPVLPDNIREAIKGIPTSEAEKKEYAKRPQVKEHERLYFEQFVAVVKSRNAWTLTEAGKVDAQEEVDDVEAEVTVSEPCTISDSANYVDFVDDNPRSSPILSDEWEEAADSIDDYLDGHPINSKEGLSSLRTNAKKVGNTRLYASAKEFIRSLNDGHVQNTPGLDTQ